mgnify:CR=1 FL=1
MPKFKENRTPFMLKSGNSPLYQDLLGDKVSPPPPTTDQDTVNAYRYQRAIELGKTDKNLRGGLRWREVDADAHEKLEGHKVTQKEYDRSRERIEAQKLAHERLFGFGEHKLPKIGDGYLVDEPGNLVSEGGGVHYYYGNQKGKKDWSRSKDPMIRNYMKKNPTYKFTK